MAGVEAVAFGVLVFLLGSLVVANAWGVIDAKLATASAAREATRAYVEAPSAATAARAAETAGRETIQGYGRRPARLRLLLAEGSFSRCARVTFEARYRVEVVAVPVIGRGRGFTVAARHSEIVDPYRAGPQGRATCATGKTG